MDFKWRLSRPGIELEFETGSISEAIGLLTDEGTQISDIFGFPTGNSQAHGTHQEAKQTAPDAEPAKRGRKPKAATEAVAPEPLPVPVSAAPPLVPMPSATTVLPPNALDIPADGGIPPFLARTAPLPALPVSPPPVGLLGPKVVKAMDLLVATAPDGGQAMADWLAASGLTIKGKSYDDACRAVLMISDEKLKDVADALNV